jgi:hypothetical protein
MVSLGSILIVLLLLASENGLRKANGYVAGYVLTYTIVGMLVVATGASQFASCGSLALAASFVKLGLGGLFLGVALRRLLTRDAPLAQASLALLFQREVSVTRTFAVGSIAPLINLKNLVIYLYAASLVSVRRPPGLMAPLHILAITLVFCSTTILPVFASAIAPGPTRLALGRLRTGLELHGRAIAILLLSAFGALFMAQAVIDLIHLS